MDAEAGFGKDTDLLIAFPAGLVYHSMVAKSVEGAAGVGPWTVRTCRGPADLGIPQNLVTLLFWPQVDNILLLSSFGCRRVTTANTNARMGQGSTSWWEKNMVTLLECVWGWDIALCGLKNLSAPTVHLSRKLFGWKCKHVTNGWWHP